MCLRREQRLVLFLREIRICLQSHFKHPMLTAKDKPGQVTGTALAEQLLTEGCEGSPSSQRGKEELFLIPRDHSPHLFIRKDQVSLDMIELIPIQPIQNIQPALGSATLGGRDSAGSDPHWLMWQLRIWELIRHAVPWCLWVHWLQKSPSLHLHTFWRDFASSPSRGGIFPPVLVSLMLWPIECCGCVIVSILSLSLKRLWCSGSCFWNPSRLPGLACCMMRDMWPSHSCHLGN